MRFYSVHYHSLKCNVVSVLVLKQISALGCFRFRVSARFFAVVCINYRCTKSLCATRQTSPIYSAEICRRWPRASSLEPGICIPFYPTPYLSDARHKRKQLLPLLLISNSNEAYNAEANISCFLLVSHSFGVGTGRGFSDGQTIHFRGQDDSVCSKFPEYSCPTIISTPIRRGQSQSTQEERGREGENRRQRLQNVSGVCQSIQKPQQHLRVFIHGTVCSRKIQ